MDKDIRKILNFIIITIIILGIPTGYFLWQYREKIIEIEWAEKITLPEEELPDKVETPISEGNVVEKNGESVVGSIFDKDDEEIKEPEEPVETPVSEEEKGDGKEGLIIDNSNPNPFDKNNPTVNFGPTTGKMGSKVNPWDVSGFKKELAKEVHNLVGNIKTDPKRVLEGHDMAYFSEDVSEKVVEDIMTSRVQDYLMGKRKEMTPPESVKIGEDNYLVTTMDVWKLETVYDNPEGILNEIKLQTPDFLRTAFLPSYGGFSYNYGVVSVYFDAETDKNEVVMILYNFVKIKE